MHKAKVLALLHQNHPQAIVYHYMDNILIAGENDPNLHSTLKATITATQQAGLTVAEENITLEIFGT